MQLPPETKIAGDKKVSDWNTIKISLSDFNNEKAWECAYNDFFLKRLEDRYIIPIELIIRHGGKKGEGFSVMTILCSLVEFLESTYQGKNYRYRKRKDPPLEKFEYDKSSTLFISFLTNRSPFDNEFNKSDAKDFYENVRCGLLHEAKTNGKWIIKAAGTSKNLIENKNNFRVIHRDNFYTAVRKFIIDYRVDLLTSNDRKEAFVRKFDGICDQ